MFLSTQIRLSFENYMFKLNKKQNIKSDTNICNCQKSIYKCLGFKHNGN